MPAAKKPRKPREEMNAHERWAVDRAEQGIEKVGPLVTPEAMAAIDAVAAAIAPPAKTPGKAPPRAPAAAWVIETMLPTLRRPRVRRLLSLVDDPADALLRAMTHAVAVAAADPVALPEGEFQPGDGSGNAQPVFAAVQSDTGIADDALPAWKRVWRAAARALPEAEVAPVTEATAKRVSPLTRGSTRDHLREIARWAESLRVRPSAEQMEGPATAQGPAVCEPDFSGRPEDIPDTRRPRTPAMPAPAWCRVPAFTAACTMTEAATLVCGASAGILRNSVLRTAILEVGDPDALATMLDLGAIAVLRALPDAWSAYDDSTWALDDVDVLDVLDDEVAVERTLDLVGRVTRLASQPNDPTFAFLPPAPEHDCDLDQDPLPIGDSALDRAMQGFGEEEIFGSRLAFVPRPC